jgi:hypothetical protein
MMGDLSRDLSAKAAIDAIGIGSLETSPCCRLATFKTLITSPVPASAAETFPDKVEIIETSFCFSSH